MKEDLIKDSSHLLYLDALFLNQVAIVLRRVEALRLILLKKVLCLTPLIDRDQVSLISEEAAHHTSVNTELVLGLRPIS